MPRMLCGRGKQILNSAKAIVTMIALEVNSVGRRHFHNKKVLNA